MSAKGNAGRNIVDRLRKWLEVGTVASVDELHDDLDDAATYIEGIVEKIEELGKAK